MRRVTAVDPMPFRVDNILNIERQSICLSIDPVLLLHRICLVPLDKNSLLEGIRRSTVGARELVFTGKHFPFIQETILVAISSFPRLTASYT